MFLRICLTDIPRDLIREGNNGKKYINLNVGELQAPDEHGNDHYVSVYVPKNSRGSDDKPIFIGRGELRKDGNSPRGGNSPRENSPAKDNLPFDSRPGQSR